MDGFKEEFKAQITRSADVTAECDLKFSELLDRLPIADEAKFRLAELYNLKGVLEKDSGKMSCALKLGKF